LVVKMVLGHMPTWELSQHCSLVLQDTFSYQEKL